MEGLDYINVPIASMYWYICLHLPQVNIPYTWSIWDMRSTKGIRRSIQQNQRQCGEGVKSRNPNFTDFNSSGVFKTFMTFHYTDWFIGILKMAYEKKQKKRHIIWYCLIPYIKQPTRVAIHSNCVPTHIGRITADSQ